MPKSTKKKNVKKEKVSSKKKIKEISKEKLKEFEEELKGKKSEQTNKPKEEIQGVQRISEEPAVNLEEFLREVKPSVLDRVAIAGETQSTTRIIQARDGITGNETSPENSDYASTSSDYADITPSNQGTTGNNPQYTEVTNTFRNSQNDKEHRETSRLFRRDDYSAGSKQNNFERTIKPEIEGADETRKYFTKGDKK